MTGLAGADWEPFESVVDCFVRKKVNIIIIIRRHIVLPPSSRCHIFITLSYLAIDNFSLLMASHAISGSMARLFLLDPRPECI